MIYDTLNNDNIIRLFKYRTLYFYRRYLIKK